MSTIEKTNKQLYLLFILFFSIFFIFGCSQNIPEINETLHSIVFTYEGENSLPEARLSLFVETTTDPRRCERIELHSLESDYYWKTKKITKISSSERKWSGNVNFVVPKGERIPMGKYDVKYILADETEDNSSFIIKYDERFYTTKCEKINDLISDKGELKIAIYDNSRILIYLGEKTEDLSSKGDIFNAYNEAVYYQDVWFSDDNSVICILPENKL